MQTSFEIIANGEVRCPDCGEMIHVGTAGIENLNKQHQSRGQKACVENKKKNDANVNNWMREACDAEKTCQGGNTALR
jgi:hypothetical protein